MELKAMEFLLAEMLGVRDELRGNNVGSSKDLDKIQEDSIIGNSERMMFYSKELVAAAEDPRLLQNPFVLTKISMSTIRDFEFDHVQQPTFKKKNRRPVDADKKPGEDTPA
jgi:hypothetical protein